MKPAVAKATVVLLMLAALTGATGSYTAPEPAEPIEPPVYPPEALEEGFEGECLVALLVDSDGSVTKVWLVRPSGRDDVDAACLEAARGTRWHPATLSGVPVSSQLAVPFRFERGVLPGDPLYPAVAGPVEPTETSEPVLELRPLEPLEVDHPPTADGGFAVVGLEVDELGLVLKAWIIRPSGHGAADDRLLDAAYASRWEGAIPEGGVVRGVYVHEFRGDSAVSTVEAAEEEPPVEDPTIDQSGGGCAFDQLRIGKHGER
jgi:TonB family protein